MLIAPEKDEVAIVLLGSFNPRIFHPAWLAMNKLISSDDANNADLEIAHKDITHFKASGMTFTVETGRFSILCAEAIKGKIFDLVLSCFGELLPHTPIHSLGINRMLHFPCKNEPSRHALGKRLAPYEPWGEWGKEIEERDTATNHGGMMRLSLRQQPLDNGLNGYVQAEVRPSQIIKEGLGVAIDVNNHFVLVDDPDAAVGAVGAVSLIEEHWDRALQQGEKIISGLMAVAKEVEQ